jgi:ferric-dicitrate binding protein FerR (iron transport regulator)
LKKLIKKYLKGNCNPEEIAAIHEWYDSFETEQDPADFITSQQQKELKFRLLTNIRRNVASLELKSTQTNKRKTVSRTLYLLSGVAAMLILTIGIFFYVQKKSSFSDLGDVHVVNMTKTIQKLVLSDGSIVWLNPKSKVIYPHNFTSTLRKVQMQGEAFFEVSPDPKRPFIIYSGNVITRVWGTSFRIRAYENIPFELSVLTGKVSVQLQTRKDSELIVLPQQTATYLTASDLLKKGIEKKTSAMSIWHKETMTFDNEPIREVIKVLNAQFKVNISTADEKLLDYVLKADFNDQSLPSILEMLRKSLNVENEISDDGIILYTNNN